MSEVDSVLDRLVTRARQFYSLPAVAMKVVELTGNPQVDPRAVKECIENDPALTMKVLRVVNSSLFGLSREVSNLNQALALLGTKPLRLLVLGFSLPNALFNGVAGNTLGWYWRHALTKAVAAREISESLWQQPGDEAFIAGLLQDLGILLLIQELGQPYISFAEKVLSSGYDLAEAEEESIGFRHTALSARLLHHWGLPPLLTEAVCDLAPTGDSPPAAPTVIRLRQTLAMAELVARLVADGHAEVLDDLLSQGREHGLDPEKLESLVGGLQDKVEQLADVLSLQLPDGMSFQDVLVHAHAQLAEVAASAAGDLAFGTSAPPIEIPKRGSFQTQQPAASQTLAATLARHVEKSTEAGSPVKTTPVSADVSNATAVMPAAGGNASSSVPNRKNAAASRAAFDPGLLGHLTAYAAGCRQARCALSLILIELCHADDLVLTHGIGGFTAFCDAMQEVCQRIDRNTSLCLRCRDAGFALILPNCDRPSAVRLGNELIEQIRRQTLRICHGDPAPSIGVGAATVPLIPKNFPAKDLLAGADRCLYGSLASGGGVVKSIEIY
jgi:HD-like signal output (HDOD) protein/GGDEF domain-containing protein